MRHALAIHCPGCNQPIEVLLSVNHGPRWGNTHITLDRPINHVCQEDPMTIHSDRDGSEQPIVWPPKQRRDAETRYAEGGLPGLGRVVTEGIEVGGQVFERMLGTTLPREGGTSPVESARAAHASGGGAGEPVRASAAQVEAVEKAWWNGSFNRYGAPRRVTFRAIADAVVAAGPDADEVTRLARAVASVTPCSCSAQRSRAEAAEAEVERLLDAQAIRAGTLHDANNAVRDLRAERDRLRAEAARLRGEVNRAASVAERLHSEFADHALHRARAQKSAEARADRLAATVERVRAVAKRWGGNGTTLGMEITKAIASTPETPHAPAGRDESASGQSGGAGTLGGAEAAPVDLLAALQHSITAAKEARADR
jgi:hypothetical protein